MPIFYILMISLAFLLIGCDSTQTLDDGIEEEQYVKTEQELAIEATAQQMVQEWSVAYEGSALLSALEKELEDWQGTTQGKQFMILDFYDAEKPWIGVYESDTDWYLEAKNLETDAPNSPLHIRMKDNQAILTYDDVEQEMSLEEIFFLLPFRHIEILHDMIKEKSYVMTMWSPVEDQAFEVQIISSIASLEDKFFTYIYGDSSEELEEREFFLLDSSYQLHYTIRMEEENRNSFTINSIQVMLEKQGLPMEQLLYSFEDLD